MTTFELEEYLETHSRIVDNFRDKYAAFLNEQNADRPTNKKWSSLRIKNETSSAVIKFISNIQAKLSSAMKPRQRKSYDGWVDYMERNNVIDDLEESMVLVQKFSDDSILSIIGLKSEVAMMKNYFKGRHFQKDIILVAVGYYFRFSLSYREIVEILRDRGIAVHHTTIMRWVHHYGPLFKLLWRKQRCSHSQSWRVDETYIKINGRWCYFYRAIDSHGLTLDFELRKHRDYQSAYHFLRRLLTAYGCPNCLVTDQYGGTLKAIKQVIKDGLLATENHQCSKYRNNLIEQDHRLIKHVLVKSSGFQSLRTALKTLSGIEVMHQLHKQSQREPNIFGFSALQSLTELLTK